MRTTLEIDGLIHNPGDPQHFMRLKPAGLVEIWADGRRIARSERALRCLEVGRDLYDPVLYLPMEDVEVARVPGFFKELKFGSRRQLKDSGGPWNRRRRKRVISLRLSSCCELLCRSNRSTVVGTTSAWTGLVRRLELHGRNSPK